MTPVDVAYSGPGNGIIRGGIAAPSTYPWAASLINDTFVTVGTITFAAWAAANVPAGAYLGTNPFGSMVDAFCEPTFNPITGKLSYYGGGHGDGSCNAVIENDPSSQGFAIVGAPTPPAKYPPAYISSGSSGVAEAIYPSGLNGNGFFLDNMTDPADTPYNTPRARFSTHMYAAAAYRLGKNHYFYKTPAIFNVASGTWQNMNGFAYGPQLITFRPQYNDLELQQGTVALYDSVTDNFFVTLVPGDGGGGWRSAIMVIDGPTMNIEQIFESSDATYGIILESCALCMVGRKIYMFTHLSANRGIMNGGIIFDMDTHVMAGFTLTGDTEGSVFAPSPTQETIPCWYDGRAIRRWNYTAGLTGKIFSVNPVPESGTGAIGNPYVLRQTMRLVSNPPTTAQTIYSRIVYLAEADCAWFIPKSTTLAVALKLS